MNIVAHRGYSGKYPGNTLAAFDAALRHPECGKKITGMEIDIQLSSDNKIVVFHDNEIEVEGLKKAVSSLTHDELVEMERPKLKGEKVCLFEDVLNLVEHRLELLVEIKAGKYQPSILLESVADLMKLYRPAGSEIIVHSFSAEIMRDALRRLADENVKYGILCSTAGDLEKFEDILDKIDYVHPYWKAILETPDAFAETRRPLHIWTVNSKEDFGKLMSLPCKDSIRAVMTDELDLICEI
ncbi:MAG: glycerophosphodiester phosphodiesterase family protein [Victivallales bacterium]|jgi:glycerophosphoryl diester phosphodiesterase